MYTTMNLHVKYEYTGSVAKRAARSSSWRLARDSFVPGRAPGSKPSRVQGLYPKRPSRVQGSNQKRQILVICYRNVKEVDREQDQGCRVKGARE